MSVRNQTFCNKMGTRKEVKKHTDSLMEKKPERKQGCWQVCNKGWGISAILGCLSSTTLWGHHHFHFHSQPSSAHESAWVDGPQCHSHTQIHLHTHAHTCCVHTVIKKHSYSYTYVCTWHSSGASVAVLCAEIPWANISVGSNVQISSVQSVKPSLREPL